MRRGYWLLYIKIHDLVDFLVLVVLLKKELCQSHAVFALTFLTTYGTVAPLPFVRVEGVKSINSTIRNLIEIYHLRFILTLRFFCLNTLVYGINIFYSEDDEPFNNFHSFFLGHHLIVIILNWVIREVFLIIFLVLIEFIRVYFINHFFNFKVS